MAKAHKPTDYESLRKIWYKKLKAKGFDDIETASGALRGHSTEFSRPRAEWQGGGLAAKAEYYRLADRLLNEYEFANKRDKIIWEYHTNGISVRDIAKILHKAKVKGTVNKDTVATTVQRLRDIMKSMYIPKGPNE